MSQAWADWQAFDWANPGYAALAWLLALLLAWALLRLKLPGIWSLPAQGARAGSSWAAWLVWLPAALRIAGLALLLIALARPQKVNELSESSVQSIDIFLSIDVSGSMQAPDLKPNRLAAAKETLKRFVDGMKGDRVGMVVFAGRAFVQCPLSLDREVVKYFIDKVDFGTVRLDGTAVGDGLLMAVQRLIQEPKAGQVVILATDGRSNTGIPPLQAAQVAAQAGIKLYTIGIGVKGGAVIRQQDMFGRVYEQRMEEPDEATLSQMAQLTGGRYFRATDENGLASIYAQIASLERRDVKVKNRREADEKFWPFLYLGALLLAAEALLRLRLRVLA